MPKTDALIYQSLKTALLRRFELTDDGFKTRFRSCRPEQCETFAQFSARLSSYFDRWIEMAKVPRTFDGLYDLMLGDQFIHICSQDLRFFPKNAFQIIYRRWQISHIKLKLQVTLVQFNQ